MRASTSFWGSQSNSQSSCDPISGGRSNWGGVAETPMESEESIGDRNTRLFNKRWAAFAPTVNSMVGADGSVIESNRAIKTLNQNLLELKTVVEHLRTKYDETIADLRMEIQVLQSEAGKKNSDLNQKGSQVQDMQQVVAETIKQLRSFDDVNHIGKRGK